MQKWYTISMYLVLHRCCGSLLPGLCTIASVSSMMHIMYKNSDTKCYRTITVDLKSFSSVIYDNLSTLSDSMLTYNSLNNLGSLQYIDV